MMTLLCSLALVGPQTVQDDLLRTWKAVIYVESRGDPQAVGDGGKAVGVGQIHQIIVDDVARILGKRKYTYDDRKDPVKSWEMFRIYSRYYLPNGTPEQWARCWNSGPQWRKKLSKTDRYWKQIRSQMQKGGVQ